MPLPNYGHGNKEKKQHQDLVFEMKPEIVSDEEEYNIVNGKKVKRKRGKVTTGKLGIDMERKLVIHAEKDKDIWTCDVDPRDVEAARKFSSPERQVLKKSIRSELDSLISEAKARSVKGSRRPSCEDIPSPSSSDFNKSVRFSIPDNNRHVEKNVTGVSIQPSGTYVQPKGLTGTRGWTTVQPNTVTYRHQEVTKSRSFTSHGVRGLN